MMTPQDIEAQLSYAYLHAVASHAGIACQEANRAHDNQGIDATLSLRKDFGPGALWEQITLHLQLKATIKPPSRKRGRLSYFLEDVDEYDRLRRPSHLPPRLLAVLFLPPEHPQWLTHSADQLVLCRCAYWVSLRGAPPSANAAGQTVYLPEAQALSPTGLLGLFERIAREEELRYEP